MAGQHTLQLLLIEDNPGDVRLIAELLKDQLLHRQNAPVYKIAHVETMAAGLAHLNNNWIDVILLDLNLPDCSGLNTFNTINDAAPDVPIIILTGLDDIQLAGQAMQAGAQDYLDKAHLNPYLLDRAIRYALERQYLRLTLQQKASALTASENRLRTIIDNLPDDIFVKDRSNRFISVNLAAMRSLGAESPQEVVGQTEEDFLHTPATDTSFSAEMDLFTTGTPIINQEERIPNRENNRDRWVLSTKVPLRDSDGQIIGLVCIRRDVTERRNAEEALKREHSLLAQRVEERTSELREANLHLSQALRVKDEFLASMSHELRTPLNAILGMSEILREGVYGTLNEQQLNSVNIVQESGRHLLALINDILDVSRIEADKLELKISPVSVDSVCQASLRFVQRAAEKKGIKISEEYQPNNLVIQADERRLKQVLVNLLNNAVKFTPNNGKIGLIVSASAEAQQLKFTVWDTGIGIAQQDIKKVFKPFVQLDSRLAREYEGSGLGLALVHLLTEMHNGYITVESEVGRGSRFELTFPWHNTYEQTEPQPDAPPPEDTELLVASHKHPLLLLAEDNQANVEVMSSYLSAKGYRVVTANDGAEAVKYAKKLQPDLIIMDIHMPEMDGLEATREIRSAEALTHIPIIALTALAMPGDKERCLAAGINDYLSKPVSLRRLTEAIEENLRGRMPTKDEA